MFEEDRVEGLGCGVIQVLERRPHGFGHRALVRRQGFEERHECCTVDVGGAERFAEIDRAPSSSLGVYVLGEHLE